MKVLSPDQAARILICIVTMADAGGSFRTTLPGNIEVYTDGKAVKVLGETAETYDDHVAFANTYGVAPRIW